MAWQDILTPADMPPELKAVLVSNGSTTGVAYHREQDPDVIKKFAFRPDCWVLIWPGDPDQSFVVKKWDELPQP